MLREHGQKLQLTCPREMNSGDDISDSKEKCDRTRAHVDR